MKRWLWCASCTIRVTRKGRRRNACGSNWNNPARRKQRENSWPCSAPCPTGADSTEAEMNQAQIHQYVIEWRNDVQPWFIVIIEETERVLLLNKADFASSRCDPIICKADAKSALFNSKTLSVSSMMTINHGCT